MQRVKLAIEDIIIDLERQRSLLTLALEETSAITSKLDINNQADMLKAFSYAQRAEIMQALIDSVDSALMFIIDELDDPNHEDAA